MSASLRLAAAGVLAALIVPAAASAAPPANDNRADAEAVTLPAVVSGTTSDATVESPAEAPPSCASIDGSVWYAFTAPRAGRLVARLRAEGDQDASLDVIRRVRSELLPLTCARTDQDGSAVLTADVAPGGTYLVRVARRTRSVAGPFRLELRLADPPPEFPGAPLPAGGARGTLDVLSDPQDGFSVSMQAGTSYIVSTGLSRADCLSISLAGPRADSFRNADATGCSWIFYTPTRSGRHTILLSTFAGEARRYRLRVRAVRGDEMAPGVRLPNLVTVRGRVSPSGDPLDLFRFDVPRRSRLSLNLAAGEDQEVSARVYRANGGGVTTASPGEEATATLRRGRYFVAVFGETRADYTLRRAVRTITASRLSIRRSLPFGATMALGVRVSPRVNGPVSLTVERFEPVFGWQFDSRRRATARNGRAALRFRPSRSGLWRVSASYLGTSAAAPSDAGRRTFTVVAPLRP